MLIRGITIAGDWQPYLLLSCYAALFLLRVIFDIFLSWEYYDSRHPNYVSALKHNCNVMKGEAEMGLDMYEGGIGSLGVRVHMEKVLGMELPGRRKRGMPRRRYMDVNCEG